MDERDDPLKLVQLTLHPNTLHSVYIFLSSVRPQYILHHMKNVYVTSQQRQTVQHER